MSSTVDRGVAILRDLDDWVQAQITHAEATLIRFIIRRTYMVGRVRWGITIKEMVNGVNINGKGQVCLGTGLSRATVVRALASLDEKRLIQRGKKHLNDVLAMNVLEIDEDEFDNLVERGKKGRTMGRKKGTDRRSESGLNLSTSEAQFEHQRGSKRATPRGRGNVGENSEGTARAPDSTLEAIEAGKKKYTEGTARRLKKHSKKAGPPSMTVINDYIKVLISRHGLQSIAPLTQKDYGVFKKHYLASPESYQKVLDWAVPHWGTVRENHFDYDRKFPMIPTLRYIAYNWRRLLDAYREDMRNARDYVATDERKATRIQKTADAIAAEKKKADEALAQAEREKEEKDRQIKDLRSRLGDDKPFDGSTFRKLYHYDD